MKDFDFLVVGSGIAGLIYAIQVSKLGKVAIITKKKLCDCNTEYAQGGIAAVLSRNDSIDDHIEDTYIAGAKLSKKYVAKIIIKEGEKLIKYLMDLGTNFTLQNPELDRRIENLSLTKEGGHSHKRVAYSSDSTGHEIMRALITNIKENSNITIFENHMAVDLITQHHVSQDKMFIPNITCWGAYVLNTKTNKVEIFRAKKTMLATGGGSQVYSNNTNPDVATGDGYAIAHLAGSRMVNMEFVQFHPTAFYSPEGKTFLITEALRGEGAVLRLQNGEEFLHKYHPKANLAPRDIVARAIDFEMKKRNYKFVYLDATKVDKKKLLNHFPYINKKLLKRNIDFTKEYIPVVPAAHYFCGGILATVDGLTDIKNLFVAGEVACTGLHGANRLASNSLLEALVVAYRAGNHPANKDTVKFPKIPKWNQPSKFNENEWIIISHNFENIQKIMTGYVGITRSNKLLRYALNRINNIYDEIDNFYKNNPVRKEVLETRNLAIVAKLIILSAMQRKESRGLHYNIDYPNQNDLYKKDTII